jgi:hypothetical protein
MRTARNHATRVTPVSSNKNPRQPLKSQRRTSPTTRATHHAKYRNWTPNQAEAAGRRWKASNLLCACIMLSGVNHTTKREEPLKRSAWV